MANYMQLGDYYDPDMGEWVADPTAAYDYPTDQPASPGYSQVPEGGSGVDWGAIGTTAMNVVGQVAGQIVAANRPVTAVPIGAVATPGILGGGVAAPGQIVAAGSIGSGTLVFGGLALAALFLFRKK